MAARRAVPESAALELRLVRESLAEHDCSEESLACALGVSKTTVSRWFSGSRPPSPVVVAALQHDPDVALALLVRLCAVADIDVGDVLRERARREVRAVVLRELADALLDQAATPTRQAA